MGICDRLYALDAADYDSAVLQIFNEQALKSDTATTVQTDFSTIPADKVLCLTSLSLSLTPGSTQAGDRIAASVVDQAGVAVSGLPLLFAQGLVSTEKLDAYFTGHFLVAPGHNVRITGYFDAGVNSNTLSGWLHGQMIPRANILEY